ncbi:protein SOSEKI 3-like isoform X1 [Lycium ferocissimum]|uniref:protein SOSEKI 3-like isoform X1 n=1 Tax=Lycium ferocissimum TaxID=112874 RepID=UPI002814EA99|nr:protein SOSEKI 3-like isoform X1 [Lycium ferocissimum]
MEERMKKYRQLSPERAKVWTEKSPKYHQQQQPNDGKVPVVYYLCRNRQLEHPHFMEVPISSSDGLYLRDLIKRFNVLRGKGMASSYSWSCKRSYKNRFVWHDLCEDDLILPVHGNEYVLKGSEICEESNSGRSSPAKNDRLSNPKELPESPASRSQDDPSPPSSTNERCANNSCDGENPSSSDISPVSFSGKCSSCRESMINKTDGLADASTKTWENTSSTNTPHDTFKRGVSTNYCPSSGVENNEIRVESAAHPPSSSGRTDSLISLIRSDVSKLSSFRTRHENGECSIPSAKLKPHNMLMQLISCGSSISVKDHRFSLIEHKYKPSLSLGKLDCLTRNLRLEEEEYFCASWTECTAKRTNKQLAGDSVRNQEGPSSRCSKSIQHSTNASLNNGAKK